jgi:HD superfamily phosphodiesterase
LKLDKEEIIQLTERYGGRWGLSHTNRLLNLVSVIGKNENYNKSAVWLAAHLHDWGAYAPFALDTVDHAERSAQVAEQVLLERDCGSDLAELVITCIRYHHSCDPENVIEAVLLADADGLDFLGIVGILRDFSKNPKELRKAFEISNKRFQTIPPRLILEKSKEIAFDRVRHMEDVYKWFEEESLGCY